MFAKNKTALIILCALLLALITGCKETRVTAEQVRDTIVQAEKDLHWIDYRLDQEHWRLLDGKTSDSLEFFNNLKQAYLGSPEKLSILRNNRNLIKDDELFARKYDILFGLLIKGNVENGSQITSLRDSILSLHAINPPRIGSERLTENDIDRILAIGTDRTRREMAYRARYTAEQTQVEMMGQLIRSRNQEASRMGYNDYFAMTFPDEGPSLTEYRKLLDDLETATDAPYQAILDRFNTAQVEPWDLIWELGHDLNSLYSRPTLDSQWTVVSASMNDLGFDLAKLPIYEVLSENPSLPASVTPLAVNPPSDLRLIGNTGRGCAFSAELLGSLARLIHEHSVTETEPLFVSYVDGAWTTGVADLFTDMTRDSVWLANYLGLSPVSIPKQIKQLNELELVKVRLLLLKLNFEYEAYRSRPADLNRLYWDLSDRIMRLNRHDDITPWATDMELANAPVTSQNHLLGKLIAVQTRAYLKQYNGQVVGNRETRSFLIQNYMRFGSRYPWSELLKRGAGEALTYEYLVGELVTN